MSSANGNKGQSHPPPQVAFPFLLGGGSQQRKAGGGGGGDSGNGRGRSGGHGGRCGAGAAHCDSTSSRGGGRRANINRERSTSSNSSSTSSVDGPAGTSSNITRAVVILRATVLVLLVLTATLVSVGVYLYTKNIEQFHFEQDYERNALRVLDSFHEAVERRLSAINSMANSITSHAMATNQTFPFVTIPDFALRGADLRIQATNPELHWLPLVTNENRDAWEAYARQNRFQIDQAFEQDQEMRQRQDEMLGLADDEHKDDGETSDPAQAQQQQQTAIQQQEKEENILKDGSGFHPRIHSNGDITPKGDEVNGTGPFLPLWQRSPINELKQKTLNRNFANTKIFHGILPAVLQTNEAIMNRATVPTPQAKVNVKLNLRLSQYRHVVDEHVDDPLSFLAYPVFDSFQSSTRKLGGVLAMNIYWKLLFENILSPAAVGFVCVLENSYGQVMSYRIDGADASFLGLIDAHDERYNDFVVVADINSYLERRKERDARPETTRSYMAVPLNSEFGKYTLRIYPTQDTQDSYVTNDPAVYTIIIVFAFAFTSIVFCCFVFVVEQRQDVVMTSAIANAQKVAAMERELNLFLAHEVRNPLSAAMSACTFVTDTCKQLSCCNGTGDEQQQQGEQEELQKSLLDDCKIMRSSLEFIDEFLRSMLDMHRAADNQLKLTLAPTDLLRDVLDPVLSMLHQHEGASVHISVDCPENLIIMTDALRLKQVMLNLGRNATRFVDSGFIRLRATVVEKDDDESGGGRGVVELCVEDSGRGIAPDKRQQLFQKFHTSLDVLDQGTGVGLCLCQNFVLLMDGDIFLDENYSSGVEGSPGARFVIQLKSPPLSIDEAIRRVSLTEKDKQGPSSPANVRQLTFVEANDVNDDDDTDDHEAGIATPYGDTHSASGEFHSTAAPGTAMNTTAGDSHAAAAAAANTPTASGDDHVTDARNIRISSKRCDTSQDKHDDVRQELPENLSVLFVDDDLVLRKLFARALKRAAPTWKISEAACGEAALRLVLGDEESQQEPQHFDIIWMDQYMPSVQRQLLGTETVRSLRANGIQSRICGLSANDIEEAFLQAGADCFMLKPMPCDKDELWRKLFEVLGIRGLNLTEC